jgi:hypothetical protein
MWKRCTIGSGFRGLGGWRGGGLSIRIGWIAPRRGGHDTRETRDTREMQKIIDGVANDLRTILKTALDNGDSQVEDDNETFRELATDTADRLWAMRNSKRMRVDEIATMVPRGLTVLRKRQQDPLIADLIIAQMAHDMANGMGQRPYQIVLSDLITKLSKLGAQFARHVATEYAQYQPPTVPPALFKKGPRFKQRHIGFSPSLGRASADKVFMPHHKGDMRTWATPLMSRQAKIITDELWDLFTEIGAVKKPSNVDLLKQASAERIMDELRSQKLWPLDPRLLEVNWIRRIQYDIDQLIITKPETNYKGIDQHRLKRFERDIDDVLDIVLNGDFPPKRPVRCM